MGYFPLGRVTSLATDTGEVVRTFRVPAGMDFSPVLVFPDVAVIMVARIDSTHGCLIGVDLEDR